MNSLKVIRWTLIIKVQVYLIVFCFMVVTVNHVQQKVFNNSSTWENISPWGRNSHNLKDIQRSTLKMQTAKIHSHTQRNIYTVNVNEDDQGLTNGYDIDLCVLTPHRWCELVRQEVPVRGQERWPGLQPATWETNATDMQSCCCCCCYRVTTEATTAAIEQYWR